VVLRLDDFPKADSAWRHQIPVLAASSRHAYGGTLSLQRP
jgi:hypothetical protein